MVEWFFVENVWVAKESIFIILLLLLFYTILHESLNYAFIQTSFQ